MRRGTARGIAGTTISTAKSGATRWTRRAMTRRGGGPSGPIWTNRPAPAGERRIEVARDLESAAFHRPSLTPYVLGRPNYDAAIPPDQWTERLVWTMRVDALGRVTGVEVEIAEGWAPC